MKVTDLRVGMTIIERSGKKTVVEKLSPCTQPRKVHVNENQCYDYSGYVTVA